MNAEDLSMIAGAILSLAFSYVPGLSGKYEQLAAEQKRLIMLALVVIVAGVIYGLSCAGLADKLGLSVACDEAGLIGLVRAVLLTAVANQGTYALTKR